MKKRLVSILVIAVLMLSMTATASMIYLDVPDNAKVDKSPVIEDKVLTPPGLEKIVFIHYKKGFGKPGTSCGNGICEPGENANKCPADCGSGEEPADSCYSFLAKGVEWKTLPVSYYVNPSNPYGLSEEFVTNTIAVSAGTWDDATSSELFNNAYAVDYSADYDETAPDGRNEISFGADDPGTIAVTIIWGYFSGPPKSRQIVEFDIRFNTYYPWGDAALDPSVMDLQNIAVHELGHGVGLGDQYETACSEVTMYGYGDYGETKKRTLELPDITGLQEMYN
ncbi:matrixin family metalloprotease [Candidatus Woesearchaeota archaeon]|nr:matrixin family metalloprotease [Candidatus Woesearchaeota archaeon]